MTKFDILVRTVELVLIRHGVPEADIENSVDLTIAIVMRAFKPDEVAECIENAIVKLGGEVLDGVADDADFLIDLARALGN